MEAIQLSEWQSLDVQASRYHGHCEHHTVCFIPCLLPRADPCHGSSQNTLGWGRPSNGLQNVHLPVTGTSEHVVFKGDSADGIQSRRSRWGGCPVASTSESLSEEARSPERRDVKLLTQQVAEEAMSSHRRDKARDSGPKARRTKAALLTPRLQPCRPALCLRPRL